MIHVKLAGSPYEMGYQHGQALRPLVDAMVRYESRRHAHVPPSPLDLESVAQRVTQAAPALLEELQGIADGADVAYDLLLEMNLRVLHYCTVIVFPCTNEGSLLGKNLDFPIYAYQALFTVEPDDGYAFTHIGCAGSVASYGGLNRAGLAMGHAAVPLKDALDGEGLPVAFLRRQVMQHCATTRQAIELVDRYDAWRMGDNLLFLDRAGDAAAVEIQPGEQRVCRAESGALWRSNCFADPNSPGGNEEGRGRHLYLEQVLRDRQPDLSRALMIQLLSSHEGERPLCRDSTQLGYIVNPATGAFQVADGYPCQIGFESMIKKEVQA